MMRVIVLLMLAAGFALVACGSGAEEVPAPTAQPTLDLDAIPVLGEDEQVPPVPLAATDPRFPIAPATGAARTEGQRLYETFCGSCHGMVGEGEQPDPLAPGSAPPHNAEGHTWHHADQQNVATVWYGREVAGVMPAYYDRLSPDEIIQILAYIKLWWEADQLDHQMTLSQQVADQ